MYMCVCTYYVCLYVAGGGEVYKQRYQDGAAGLYGPHIRELVSVKGGGGGVHYIAMSISPWLYS